jgi:hypothetical protein
MAKVTIEGITYEGTPEELKEIFETMGGVKFPDNHTEIEEKWAKIGRKPNDYKAGDIVRLTQHSGAHEEGTLVEVSDYGMYFAEGESWGGEFDWYELIAPVESRFDEVK